MCACKCAGMLCMTLFRILILSVGHDSINVCVCVCVCDASEIHIIGSPVLHAHTQEKMQETCDGYKAIVFVYSWMTQSR